MWPPCMSESKPQTELQSSWVSRGSAVIRSCVCGLAQMYSKNVSAGVGMLTDCRECNRSMNVWRADRVPGFHVSGWSSCAIGLDAMNVERGNAGNCVTWPWKRIG